MLESMIVAFSTYSRIPMPQILWSEKSMRYSMCFFPLVGAVLGACSYGLYFLLTDLFQCGMVLSAVLLTVLPILFTGGIHMDGFLDTMDGKMSYKSKEERLKILKDPNSGAFAVIYAIVYFLLVFGFFTEITKTTMLFVAEGYVYSRILSAFSVVTLKKAKETGMVADTAKRAAKKVQIIMIILGVLWIIVFLWTNLLIGALCTVAGILVFLYYRHMAYQTFGGITGDLAGYFLQVCELVILMVAVIACHGFGITVI